MSPLVEALSLPLVLTETEEIPLYQQLYEQVRNAILSGGIAPGTRLPATRILAQELNISRNTVVGAFEMLLSEGYIESRVGDGSYVSRVLPDELLRAPAVAHPKGQLTTPRVLSNRGELLATTPVSPPKTLRGHVPFKPGIPAFDKFPYEVWVKLLARHWRNASPELLGYGEPEGYYPLRQAIAHYVGANRGINCVAEQVIIISGSQQGLDLVSRVLLDSDDTVWMEDPGYRGAYAAFIGSGVKVLPVPVDAEGLSIDTGIARYPSARLAYVTPSHQYPTGATMSLPRRLALLEWARVNGSWIIEDDYDSEYRYGSRPLPALQGLDSDESVIYLGTLSKVLAPSLRIGYLIVPQRLASAFGAARALIDRHSPTVEQAALADFISEGHFIRHIRRTRALYAERQQTLVSAVQQEMRGLLEVAPAEAGMHVIGWLPKHKHDTHIARRAAEVNIVAQPLSEYAFEKTTRPGIVLGYAGFSNEELRYAVKKLARVLKTSLH